MTNYYKHLKYLTDSLNEDGIPLNSAEAYMLLIDHALNQCMLALEYAQNYIQQTDPNDPRIAIANAACAALDYFSEIMVDYDSKEPISKEPFYCDGEDINNLPEMIIKDVNYYANETPEQKEFKSEDPSSWLEGFDWIPEYIDKKKGA